MKKITVDNGLSVRNGRLINNRPDGVTGIQRLAELKKARKREEKVSMMEEAMYRAELRADMRARQLGLED